MRKRMTRINKNPKCDICGSCADYVFEKNGLLINKEIHFCKDCIKVIKAREGFN